MLPLVIGILLLFEGHGLHVGQSHRETPGGEAVPISLDESVVQEGHLPPAEVLRKLWEEKAKLEDSKASLPESVQLVLGVFATQELDSEVKEIIQTTWMHRRGVCWLQKGPRKGCTVYTAFVVGKRSVPRFFPDELLLNASENMNTGKSFTYFQLASKMYPWATHIGKMDLDTYPFLHRLTWSLADHAKPNCYHYIGHNIDHRECGRFDHCPPAECSHPAESNFLIYRKAVVGYNTSQCWSYMQGGLYLMSTELAKIATVEDSYWSHHLTGAEDLVTGKMLTRLGRTNNLCIEHFDPLAWDHVRNMAARGKSVKTQW